MRKAFTRFEYFAMAFGFVLGSVALNSILYLGGWETHPVEKAARQAVGGILGAGVAFLIIDRFSSRRDSNCPP